MKIRVFYSAIMFLLLTSFVCKKEGVWTVNIACVSNMEDTCMIGKLIAIDVTDAKMGGVIPKYGVSSFSYMLIRNDSVIDKGNVIGNIIPVALQHKAHAGDIAIYYNLKCDSMVLPKNYSLIAIAPFYIKPK